MTTKTVLVEQLVEVTVDASKFTPDFLAEFQQSMYPFKDLDAHIEHLAQLYARGLCDDFTKFIEGYGPPDEMGIKCKVTDVTQEIALGERPR